MMNPWANRFDELLDAETLRKRLYVEGRELKGLDRRSPESAALTLHAALESIFVPTEAVVAIAMMLLEYAKAHCEAVYSNQPAFLEAVYQGSPLPGRAEDHPTPTICLSGAAGQGKSHFMKAFTRMLAGLDRKIVVDQNHPEFQMKAVWYAAVQRRKNILDVLKQMIGEHDKGMQWVDLETEFCDRAFAQGISLLIFDELQFLSLSGASDFITGFLLKVYYLGVPLVWVANYSLLHKMSKRRAEEKQRLITRPIILQPESRDAKGLGLLLEEYRKTLPKTLRIDPAKDAEIIGYLSGDSWRLVKELTVLAYRAAREAGDGHVTVAHYQAAFRSPFFAAHRRDVDDLNDMAAGRARRKDLECPEEFRPIVAKRISQAHVQKVEVAVRSSMTNAERKVHDQQKTRARTSSNVLPLRKKSAERPSVEDLLKNFAEVSSRPPPRGRRG